MSRKFKSVLALSCAVLMIFTGCGKNDKGSDKDEKGKSSKENTVIDKDFKFDGVNDALTFAENAFGTVSDAVEGKLDTSVSTELTLNFGDAMLADMDYPVKELKFENNAKVKENTVANDATIFYDDKRVVSLNFLMDDEAMYVRIPELSDAYIKGDVEEIMETLTSDMGASAVPDEETFLYNQPEFGIPDEFTNALEKIDGEKINGLFEDIAEIVEDNLPVAKNGEEISGKVNDLTYKYDTKIYGIKGKNVHDAVSQILDKVKDDKELAEVYDSLISGYREEMIDSGYYTQEEIKEEMPNYGELMDMAIKEWAAEKEDAYSSTDVVDFVLFYDGDECKGISFEADGDKVTFAMIDEQEEFAIGYEIVDASEDFSETITFGLSVEGSDGKYDGKIAVSTDDSESDEYDTDVQFTFNSDVTVVDEETGAFKGNIEFGMMNNEGEKAALVIKSDSTADKTDLEISIEFNDEALMSIGLVNVVTNATDITLPKGDVFDINNESEMDEYANSIDLEGFEADLREALGDELFEDMFGSDDVSDSDDWDYDDDWEDDDWDYDDF